MLLKHFADKDQIDALTTAPFGGKERAEQLASCFLINAFTSVGNLQANRITEGTDINLAIVADRLGGVLDDVDQYLFEE